jgi:hypothetical protein
VDGRGQAINIENLQIRQIDRRMGGAPPPKYGSRKNCGRARGAKKNSNQNDEKHT